ncbi:MAG: EthD family reductase [Solirubrobacterales bacterium]|nr:EthD family reductase [Solirubrobacterales bacterium]
MFDVERTDAMVKIVVLYGHPSDPAAFENYYANNHRPLVAKVPNLQRFEAGRIIGTPDGSEASFYRVAELWFNGQEELQAAMSSPEGQETAGDLPNFATGGATVLIAEYSASEAIGRR